MNHKVMIIAILGSLLAAGCAGETATEKAARELAEKQAAELCEPERTSQQLHYMLLSVRAKEHELRTHEMDTEADIYIATFKATVEALNDSLASSIF